MDTISNHGDDFGSIELEDVNSEHLINDNSTSCRTNQNNLKIKQYEKSKREQDSEELLKGLRDKYHDLDDRDPLRARILTIAPELWSIKKISTEFPASKRQLRKSKILRSAARVLGESTIKAKRFLPLSTVNSVIQFSVSFL